MQVRASQAVERTSPPCQLFFLVPDSGVHGPCFVRKTVVLRSGWEVLPESSSSQGTPAGRAGRGSGGSVLAPFTRSLSLAPAGFRCLRG